MPAVDAIPGVRELWDLTRGDREVRVALIDGPAELGHPCFAGAAIGVVEPSWLPAGAPSEDAVGHGTYAASVVFGRHDGPVPGLAPECSGLLIPALRDEQSTLDPLNLARALDAAVDAGADIVMAEVCHPTSSGDADDLVKRALRRAEAAGVLVLAAAGNDRGECRCVPAILPEVLAVGAHDDDGRMFQFSNWGYEGHGIIGPGGNVTGADPAGDTVVHKGTSCSTPIVAGIAALLVSLQRQQGQRPDPLAVRQALLETARPCAADEVHGEPLRCMAGKLDVAAATRRILGKDRGASLSSAAPAVRLVYALGTLGYDFGTEARRDSFKQLMPVPANPYDSRPMVDHLRANVSEARSLIWTLNLELTPIYAIEADGAYAAGVYELLTRLLAGEVVAEDSAGYIQRISVPGRLRGRSARLLNGQVVPVVEIEQTRGMYGWEVNALIDAALEAARERGSERSEVDLRRSLREFLTRVYYDLRNLGATSADRALNFAATNAFQAAQTFAEAIAAGMTLDAIGVERSPFCRPDSDCWDVKLRFFDPENSRRARKVFRFTLDVSDVLPVSLGDVRTWSEAP